MQKTFLLSLTLISLVLPETKFFQRKVDTESTGFEAISLNESERDNARNKLLLNNDSSLEESEYEINYSYTYLDKKNASSISTYSAEEPSSTKYSIKYLKSLDLMLIHSYEECGQEIKENEFYGFPFVNDDGEVDIKLDFNGETTTYSSIGIPGKGDFDPINPPQAKIYELMKISKELTNLDDVKGVANKLIKVPSLLKDGPLEYSFYNAKLRMIEDNWNNNTVQNNPSELIQNQNDSIYDKWHFGYCIDQSKKSIETGTLRSNGCGIIAMFNLLLDSGAKPYLPSLIALTQILNADIALGMFGVNPLSDEYLDAMTETLIIYYKNVIATSIKDFALTLSRIILDNYIKESPNWLVTVLLLTVEQIANATINMIYNAILDILFIKTTIDLFVEKYVKSLHSLANVIDVYAEENYEAVDCVIYKDFVNTLNKYRQGIISYWNDKENITKGAHTIYFRNEGKYVIFVKVFNYKEKNKDTGVYESVYSIQLDKFQHKDDYIYGYVWRAKE